MKHQLEKLPYEYDALEPYIDKETMMVHYDKHHQAYFDKFMAAVEGTELEGKGVEEILSNLDVVPEEIKGAVKNNGGGYYHHSIFWPMLKKDVAISGDIEEAINNKWGNLDGFKEEFSEAAKKVFGSGWTWLVMNSSGELEIISTSNQDSPISSGQKTILGIDVWEHAYYLKYQNKRPDYIEAFFNIINWDQVNKNLEEAKK